MMARSLTAIAMLLLVASAASCDTDPVHASAVAALPAETPGVPVGPLHRAGQACMTCHGGEGPASQTFAMAGTVFYGPGDNGVFAGVGNAQIVIEDDTQAQYTAATNCVGNFVVRPEDWPGHPQFPVIVRVVAQPQQTLFDVPMQSHVGRASSCASCHQFPTSANLFETPGVVHLAPQDDPSFTGDPSCRVSPTVMSH
jgi:hypothetical protein